MKAVEFCYWLQGYFELNAARNSVPQLEPRILACIKAHLALVAKVEPMHGNLFVAWLALRTQGVDSLDAIGTEEVRRMLASQFQHVIDPSYGGDKEALQAIHDGKTGESWSPPRLPGMRC
jgi:hypothetical protein